MRERCQLLGIELRGGGEKQCPGSGGLAPHLARAIEAWGERGPFFALRGRIEAPVEPALGFASAVHEQALGVNPLGVIRHGVAVAHLIEQYVDFELGGLGHAGTEAERRMALGVLSIGVTG